jgi:hypothetical protein
MVDAVCKTFRQIVAWFTARNLLWSKLDYFFDVLVASFSHFIVPPFYSDANEPVEKVLLTSAKDVSGGHLTPRKHEIVDCGAF